MADSGTDNFDRDFNLSLLSADQDVIYEIEEALKRIEKGTYGMCEITGKAIPQTSLIAIPWARFRVDAQSELEQHGILQNRSLGQLGTITAPAASSKERAEKELPEPRQRKINLWQEKQSFLNARKQERASQCPVTWGSVTRKPSPIGLR